MIYCPKYKINIDETFEENCPGCIFWIFKKDEDGYTYRVCDFENWISGLKQ